MSNIVKAVSQLPENLITPEIVQAAAKEHNPKLLQYLPAKYISQELIDLIFETEKNDDGDKWNLSYIPAKSRTYHICLQAVKNKIENINDVPAEHRHGEILHEVLGQREVLRLLPLIPASSWTKQHATMLIKYIWYHHGFCPYKSDKWLNACMKVQIALSFVSPAIRNFSFYLHLLSKETIPASMVHEIIPSKFKSHKYYIILAEKDATLVPEHKFDYEVFRAALCPNKNQTHCLLNNKQLCQRLMEYLDDTLADAIARTAPRWFSSLPKPFRTAKRLQMAIENDSNHCYDSHLLDENKDRRLLTKKVCETYIRHSYCYPKFPAKVWTPAFVDYCVKQSKSLRWLEQVPRHLITWEASTRVFKENTAYMDYLPLFFITPERAKRYFRENPNNKKELPQRYFKDFSEHTGLPWEFFGGEVSLLQLKHQRLNYTYCRIGTTYIGFYWEDSDKHYKVIMTRASNRYMPAELVFEEEVSTFHKTWLEKLLSDNDPKFVKPKVDKSLLDVQAISYYGVQPMKNILGTEIFCNTFMEQPIGYCARKEGITYHTDNCGKELFEGLKLKLQGMAVPTTLKEDLKELTQDYLHSTYGFCYPGMAAFIEDYNLDPKQTYTALQLRQIVELQGKKPSICRFNRELKKIHVI